MRTNGTGLCEEQKWKEMYAEHNLQEMCGEQKLKEMYAEHNLQEMCGEQRLVA